MTSSYPPIGNLKSRPDYLCVDDFLRDLVGARALHSALELGLVDHLLRNPATNLASISAHSRIDTKALRLLLDLLLANRVVEEQAGRFGLTAPFRAALKYRDLLEAKLDFAALVAPDFMEMFSTLLTEPKAFFDHSRVFELFSYDRCFDALPENMEATRRWMRFTTALTKYEAQSCIDHHDFSRCRQLLDVGGNSGEFVLRLCKTYPALNATVLDLPLVCDLGMAHVKNEAEADRIHFVKADRQRGEFPPGFDTVCFKSMLHDWPDREMREFLEQAYRSLSPGGTLLIFERGTLSAEGAPIPYSQIPLLLFFRSYRRPEAYVDCLAGIGFGEIRVQLLELDTPFMLITAVK